MTIDLNTETYLLTAMQAAPEIGVPVVQLLRWAVLGQGPKNCGTKHKPAYTEEDLDAWKAKRNNTAVNSFDPNPQR